VLSIARFAVRFATRRNCPINGRWLAQRSA
jgi:hypothetical protein